MPSFTWPQWLIMLCISWAILQNILAARVARDSQKYADFADLFWIRIAVVVIATAYLLGIFLDYLDVITTTEYRQFLTPLTPITFIVVWGLPSYIWRKRAVLRMQVIKDAQAMTTGADTAAQSVREITKLANRAEAAAISDSE